MFLLSKKVLLILFLCFAFVGQTMATMAMPCQHSIANKSIANKSMANTSMTNKSMTNTNMANANMAMMDHNMADMEQASCCPQECQCLLGFCVSLVLPHANLFSDLSTSSLKISPQLLLMPKQILIAHFRPPILS